MEKINPKIARRIESLIDDILDNPFSGIGQGNTQKMITTSGQNTFDKIISISK